MFLNSRRLKTQGAVAIATAVGALALGACDTPTASTDLRPEGPPDVLAVLVLNDSVNGLVEAATYCKPGDEKRPVLVGLPDFTTTTLCPEDPNATAPMATDAAPDTFYVRIMFDELLDPSVEDLIPILDENGLETGSFTGTLANTQPVTLKCTGVDGALHDVPYEGYYSPSGNSVTWPVGPSLVIKQVGDVIVPTNSLCEVTIKDFVKDKQGELVPPDQRGPFKFRVSGLKPLLIDPEDGAHLDAFSGSLNGVFVQWNGNVDPASFCDDGPAMDQCEFEFTGADLGAVGADGAGPEFVYFFENLLQVEKTYGFSFKAGGKIKDECGAETTLPTPTVDNFMKTSWTTNKFKLNTTSVLPNDVVPANRKVSLNFSNFVDATSFTESDYTITPEPASKVISPILLAAGVPPVGFRINGFYQPSTEYTFTLNAGATISDIDGVVYTEPTARVIKFKTQPIAITASAPANGSIVVKAAPTAPTAISFTFNQSMNPATWTAAAVEVTGGAPVTLTAAASSGCAVPTGTSCTLSVSGVFAPGKYTAKLKQGTMLKDMLTNDYVQAADRVITFTVEEAKPDTSTPPPCLGS
jgi:hypothetical protein